MKFSLVFLSLLTVVSSSAILTTAQLPHDQENLNPAADDPVSTLLVRKVCPGDPGNKFCSNCLCNQITDELTCRLPYSPFCPSNCKCVPVGDGDDNDGDDNGGDGEQFEL